MEGLTKRESRWPSSSQPNRLLLVCVGVIDVCGREDAHIYIWREAKKQQICLPVTSSLFGGTGSLTKPGTHWFLARLVARSHLTQDELESHFLTLVD